MRDHHEQDRNDERAIERVTAGTCDMETVS
jgi:hypothetical protein